MPPPSPPGNATCTKPPAAIAGYKFSQGMNRAMNGDSIGDCGVLGQNFTGGWPELAELCSNTTGCDAVNMYRDPIELTYMYCIKSDGTDLEGDADYMTQACLGILVKVSPPPPAVKDSPPPPAIKVSPLSPPPPAVKDSPPPPAVKESPPPPAIKVSPLSPPPPAIKVSPPPPAAVKVSPSPSPPAATLCTKAVVAPAGWTFKPHQDTGSFLVCRYPEATAPTNWPLEQIDACASMPGCLSVSYSLFEDTDTGSMMPSFCYNPTGDTLDSNSTMPQACMGTMVKNSELFGGWGGWMGW